MERNISLKRESKLAASRSIASRTSCIEGKTKVKDKNLQRLMKRRILEW